MIFYRPHRLLSIKLIFSMKVFILAYSLLRLQGTCVLSWLRPIVYLKDTPTIFLVAHLFVLSSHHIFLLDMLLFPYIMADCLTICLFHGLFKFYLTYHFSLVIWSILSWRIILLLSKFKYVSWAILCFQKLHFWSQHT